MRGNLPGRAGVALAVVTAVVGVSGAVGGGPAAATTGRPGAAAATTSLSVAHRYGVVPVRSRRAAEPRAGAKQQTSYPCVGNCASVHLTYYGGPLVSSGRVEGVFWGSSTTYTPGAGPGGAMTGFYDTVGSSDWFNWLTEYNSAGTSDGGQTTNQVIGPVSSLGETVITPQSADNGATITDQEEQNQLATSITDGALPAPAVDGQGNVDTIYALYMPNNKKLTGPDGAGTGGVQWCAYHNTMSYDGLAVPYMVLPAVTAGSAYASGCGDDPTLLGQFTNTVSHELVESVTDPDIGLDTQAGYAYPAAWGDDANGEVADICDTGDYATVGGYDVQPLWSQTDRACIASRPYVNLTPGDATVSVGSPQTFTATANGGTDVSASTTLSITPIGNGQGSCTGNVCTPTQPGTYLVNGTEAGVTTDTVLLVATALQPQTVEFTSTAPSDATVGGPTYTPTASATSGLPVAITLDTSSTGCSLSSGVVSFTAVGTCVLDADQSGGSGYAAATEVQQSFAVGPDPARVPKITSFGPAKGKPGTKVTVKGSNLAGATSLTFNGVPATIVSDTAGKIVTRVPVGATTGPLTVTTAVGGSSTSKKKFKVT